MPLLFGFGFLYLLVPAYFCLILSNAPETNRASFRQGMESHCTGLVPNFSSCICGRKPSVKPSNFGCFLILEINAERRLCPMPFLRVGVTFIIDVSARLPASVLKKICSMTR